MMDAILTAKIHSCMTEPWLWTNEDVQALHELYHRHEMKKALAEMSKKNSPQRTRTERKIR